MLYRICRTLIVNTLCCVIFLAISLAAPLAYAAEAPKAPQKAIPITVPQKAKLKRPIVRFPHASHKAEKCTTCHHKLKEKKGVYTCATTGCHDLANPVGKEKKSIKYFRNAFHLRTEASCNGCHVLRKKAKKAHGPTACKACHKK